MLIFRYLFKETIKSQLAVMLVLLLIFVSQRFVQVLRGAVDGSIPGGLVAQLILLYTPTLMMLILPISLFIGVLFAHGRLYAESEATVMLACGYSPGKIMRDTLVLALLTTAVAFANTLYVSPYSNQVRLQILDQVNADTGLATLMPGRFEKMGKQVVTFVEEIEDKGKMLKKVFVAHSPAIGEGSHARPSVVMASSGGVETHSDGSQWLSLNDGKRYEGQLNAALDFQILNFKEYQMWLREGEVAQKKDKMYARPTSELWHSNDLRYIAELQWRLSLPLSIPILTLLVVPISVVNPRQGRYAKLFPAIMLYLSYYLMMSAARSALEDGSLHPSVGLWSVHVLMFVIAVMMLFVRSESYLHLVAWLKGELRVSNS